MTLRTKKRNSKLHIENIGRGKGFLQPEEIEKIRKQYGLSQKNFARLLGWGDITIHRYESGAIQDDA